MNRKSQARHMKEALAWAYQFVGARGGTKEELDNLSAVLHGKQPPHEWKAADATRTDREK